MIAIVGLGNPGNDYRRTKHNAGFWVLDEMANRYKISFKPGKGDYVVAIKPNKFLLFKPTTGMNNSGHVVSAVYNTWKILMENIIIVLDDVDLPLGSIRIRPKGGDGSHKGLESIIYSLNTNEIPRLRFGIGTDEKMRPSEHYVLKPFNSKNQDEVFNAVTKAADALDSFLFNGLQKTMNKYNS